MTVSVSRTTERQIGHVSSAFSSLPAAQALRPHADRSLDPMEQGIAPMAPMAPSVLQWLQGCSVRAPTWASPRARGGAGRRGPGT